MGRYDLTLDATTTDGDRLRTVIVPHAPEDVAKVDRIRESMMREGWVGRPVILADAGDHHIALTGCHRLAAIAELDDAEVEAVMLPDDLSEDDWTLVHDANDDDDRLAALVEIAEGRDDMGGVVATMRAEIAALAQ